MKYLFLIPAIIAMIGSVLFWVGLTTVRWPSKDMVVCLLAAVSFQVCALYIASLVDR